MPSSSASFFVTNGTLRADAPCYVERQADRDLVRHLSAGEFCYLLTARQMGKSSLMVRAAQSLRRQGHLVAILDLAAIGQQLTHEQWYDGLMVRLGQQLHLEDQLDAFWCAHDRFGPCQRFFAALRQVVLPNLTRHNRAGPGAIPDRATATGSEDVSTHQKRLIIFVDELDVVRSLPFSTDELFAAIRASCNARTEDAALECLTFCLLGVATPAELMRDPHITPFNLGHRIELHDFSPAEAQPLADRLGSGHGTREGNRVGLLNRVLYWTHGHPYLTQRLCKAIAERPAIAAQPAAGPEAIDRLCHDLLLAPRARETDDNLLYVRERILRAETDLVALLELYEEVLGGGSVSDDERNDLVNQLRLSGIVGVAAGRLAVRNRIYEHVFDRAWIAATKPVAELQLPNGSRVRLRGTCTLGRTDASDVVLADAKVSRRHAVIHQEGPGELWLADRSRNGTFLNGARVVSPVLLRHLDQINIGPYLLVFHQPKAPRDKAAARTTIDRTVVQ